MIPPSAGGKVNVLGAWLTKALASCFFLSYLPAQWRHGRRLTGAGLVGTFFGWMSHGLLPVDPLRAAVVLAVAIGIGVAISDYAERLMGRKDDPRIVIDEWVGYWVTIAFLPQTALILTAGFILFRLFDVWKPSFVRRSGNLPGGWGVVMDDVLAGVLANVCLQVIRYVHIL